MIYPLMKTLVGLLYWCVLCFFCENSFDSADIQWDDWYELKGAYISHLEIVISFLYTIGALFVNDCCLFFLFFHCSTCDMSLRLHLSWVFKGKLAHNFMISYLVLISCL